MTAHSSFDILNSRLNPFSKGGSFGDVYIFNRQLDSILARPRLWCVFICYASSSALYVHQAREEGRMEPNEQRTTRTGHDQRVRSKEIVER